MLATGSWAELPQRPVYNRVPLQRSALKGIIRSEAPNVAFRVAAGVATPADLAAYHLEDDLGTRRLGPGIVLINVRNNQVTALVSAPPTSSGWRMRPSR